MRYERISADCHVDLCWLPPDLFTSQAPPALKDRMPYVTDGPKGPVWVTKKGANLGLAERHGLGRPRVRPGQDPPLRPHGLDRPLRRRQARASGG